MTFTDELLRVFSLAAIVIGFFCLVSLSSLAIMPYPGIWLLFAIPGIISGLIGLAYIYWKDKTEE